MSGQPSLDTESGGEYFSGETSFDTSSSTHHEVASKRSPGRASSAFLFTLSVLNVALGAVLALGSQISPEVGYYAARLDAVGLQGGAVALVGVVCFGLATVARSITGLARMEDVEDPEPGNSEVLLGVDQLAVDVSKVLDSTSRLAEDVAVLADTQRALVAAQQAKEAEEASTEGDEVNAVFRLAASVDQSSAHVNERLHDFDLQLRSGFERLSTTIEAVRVAAERAAAVQQPLPSTATPVEEPTPLVDVEPAPVDAGVFDESNAFGEEEITLPEASIDEPMEFLDAMERQEEPAPIETPIDEPPAPFATKESIDRLDALLPEESLRRARDHE